MHPPQHTLGRAGTTPIGTPTHAMRSMLHTHLPGSQQPRCPRRPTRTTATPDREAPSVALRSLEEPVPEDQRPVNELEQLKNSALFSWAMLPPGQYIQRLGLTWAAFVFVIAAPVSFGSFSPSQQPVEFVLASATGGLLAVSVLLLRLYSGYAFVANRLNSATIEYEETGWYDGQIFVKPPEILTRDRLLSIYQVKPVLAKLRQTLIASAGALVFSTLVLAGVVQFNGPLDSGKIRKPREVTNDGIIFSDRVRSLSQLAEDDEAAEAEAAAMGGVPGYCSDRYYRAAAGGQFCAKFER